MMFARRHYLLLQAPPHLRAPRDRSPRLWSRASSPVNTKQTEQVRHHFLGVCQELNPARFHAVGPRHRQRSWREGNRLPIDPLTTSRDSVSARLRIISENPKIPIAMIAKSIPSESSAISKLKRSAQSQCRCLRWKAIRRPISLLLLLILSRALIPQQTLGPSP